MALTEGVVIPDSGANLIRGVSLSQGVTPSQEPGASLERGPGECSEHVTWIGTRAQTMRMNPVNTPDSLNTNLKETCW